MSSGRPALTVVVACVDCAPSVTASLDSILAACSGIPAEVLVVSASRDDTVGEVRLHHPEVQVLTRPAGTLVPRLWAAGMDAARGDIVAVTIGHCVVNAAWAEALLAALEGGAAAAGGAFTLPARATRTERALFLLRYSAFLASRPAGAVPDVAADNAAYRKAILEQHRASWRDGFWEVEFHRQLSPADGPLRFTPAAVAELRANARLPEYVRQRFEHGRQFGSWRVRTGRASALRVLAAAPLVPFVMLRRVAARVRGTPARRLLLSAFPHLLLLAGAWALGEAVGAALGPARSAAETATDGAVPVVR